MDSSYSGLPKHVPEFSFVLVQMAIFLSLDDVQKYFESFDQVQDHKSLWWTDVDYNIIKLKIIVGLKVLVFRFTLSVLAIRMN